MLAGPTRAISARLGALDKRVFLKIDIEGAEWDAFSDVPDHLWSNVQGLAIEFHDLHRRATHSRVVALVRKLNEHFVLYHVNGNNYQGSVRLFPGKRIPIALEASDIRREPRQILCALTADGSIGAGQAELPGRAGALLSLLVICAVSGGRRRKPEFNRFDFVGCHAEGDDSLRPFCVSRELKPFAATFGISKRVQTE